MTRARKRAALSGVAVDRAVRHVHAEKKEQFHLPTKEVQRGEESSQTWNAPTPEELRN